MTIKTNLRTLAMAFAAAMAASAWANTPVDFSKVKIDDSFWNPRLERHSTVTLPHCIDHLQVGEETIHIFDTIKSPIAEKSRGITSESDVYKVIEGIAYSLINNPNPALEAKADEWIEKIAEAQDDDGYMGVSYNHLFDKAARYSDMHQHEMYCQGHLMEGAVAYAMATGKTKLLDVACRVADHMMTVFGPGKRDWVPGHPQVELALCKLGNYTGKKEYIDFAHWLLEERGRNIVPNWDKSFAIDIVPVKDLEKVTGHAVRAMFLFSGMADVAVALDDPTYLPALDRMWDDLVNHQMYITAGIGSSMRNEGFTADFDLPNKEAYCETCAAIALVFWAQRMNAIDHDSKYVDVIERALYNGVISGLALAGNKFFYVNPLETDGTHHRQDWYGVPCCPNQLARLLPSLGGYIYSTSPDALWVNLYIGSDAQMPDGKWSLSQKTQYPYDGQVELTLAGPADEKKDLCLRVPAWCKSYKVAVNGKTVEAPVEKGYLRLKDLAAGDKVTYTMDMPIEETWADTRVKADLGKRAITRGPLVYCMEEVDNASTYDLPLNAGRTSYTLGEPVAELDNLLPIDAKVDGGTLRFIPYYAWDNRAPGKMKVWVEYK